MYDYFVCSAGFADAVHSVKVIDDFRCEPHSPVRILLKNRPRVQTVRTPAAVKKIPAVLPEGPSRQVCQGYQATGDRYHDALTRLQLEVGELTAFGDDTNRTYHDRAVGPRTVNKPACQETAAARYRSTSIGIAWGRVVKYLRAYPRLRRDRHRQRLFQGLATGEGLVPNHDGEAD